jgi:hypothetical protein
MINAILKRSIASRASVTVPTIAGDDGIGGLSLGTMSVVHSSFWGGPMIAAVSLFFFFGGFSSRRRHRKKFSNPKPPAFGRGTGFVQWRTMLDQEKKETATPEPRTRSLPDTRQTTGTSRGRRNRAFTCHKRKQCKETRQQYTPKKKLGLSGR